MDKKELKRIEDEIFSAKGQWFALNCRTGYEDKVLKDLLQKIKSMNMEDEIFDVKISKIEVNNRIKNKFPGYVFINMIMNTRNWFAVRNTPGVTGFIGSSGKGVKPFPLTSEEVFSMVLPEEIYNEIMNLDETKKKETVQQPKKKLFTADFEIGDTVLIKDGLHEGVEGIVKDMDYSKGVAFVSIEMFGRWTNLEINFSSVKSVKEY